MTREEIEAKRKLGSAFVSVLSPKERPTAVFNFALNRQGLLSMVGRSLTPRADAAGSLPQTKPTAPVTNPR